ncbi:MAG TPA: SDR family oxidoreductase [Solirubrobacterales bacterium]|nr:SDR family oxidoreductase [Solirubrobacterales bacterium]
MAIASLSGRRCFVTGAASGIGRATALAAARQGAELYLTDVRAESLAGTVEEIERAGGRVGHSQALDIRDHDAVAALAAEIHAAHGSMDVVMNVAGVSTWGTIEKLEHSDWREMVEINLLGPISVLESFVPAMIEAGRGGHVVNVSSAAGLFGLPWHAAYSASKFGLRGVSEVLRFDLRRHGIGVSLVVPGGVATPLVETVKIAGIDAEAPSIRKLKARFEKRAVAPEVVAEKILEGIAKDRYMVYSSRDIQLGHWVQRKFEPLYTLAMRRANDYLTRAGERA